MSLQELKNYVRETIQKHPQHKGEIIDLYQLCLDEIEEVESPTNEIQNCLRDIKDLIN